MGALMRSSDWSQTPIGPVESWSPALRTMVSFLLGNRLPMLLLWGPEFCQLYNDAFRPCPGRKHPKALGRPARECWTEIWHIIGPLIETPYREGEATWSDDLLLEIRRNGFVEETHWTIAYGPVADETAADGIGGVAATAHEITEKVIGERRMVLLRELGARAAEAKTAKQACSIAAETLARHPKDIPFALLYLLDDDHKRARLAGRAGVVPGALESAVAIDLDDVTGNDQRWPFSATLASGALQVVEDLQNLLSRVPPGPWSDPPRSAVVCPVDFHIARQVAGFLVLGISSRVQFDEHYRGFCELVTSQLASAIANAGAYEEDRKRELQESEDRWQAVFENAAAGIAVTDLRGRFQAVNAAYQRMWGYTEDELRLLSFIDVTHEDDRASSLRLFTDLLEGKRKYFGMEKRYRRKDGSVIWANVYIALIADRKGTPQLAVAVGQDITERERAEEKLRESERRFRMLLESIPHHVWSFRTDGTVGYWNQRLADYTGLTAEQLKQGGWQALHPDDVQRVQEAWRKAWSEGSAYELEQRIRGHDGYYRRFLCRAIPAPDERGRLVEWFGTDTDIEDRKRAEEELQNAQAELAHITRLTTLGELSASIAHEVNQPLGAVVTNGQACLRWLDRVEPDLEEARAAVKRMIEEGSRASEIIIRIRSLAKKSPPRMMALDMNEAIEDALALMKHQIFKNDILLKTELAADLQRVQGDLVQLQQVMVNLIMNAIESMAIRNEEPRELLVTSENYNRDHIMIQVRDSGVGIEPGRIEQIFKPFVTNKNNGMGMGLSVSRSIVEAHGGRLWASRNEGVGATFRFSLRGAEDSGLR